MNKWEREVMESLLSDEAAVLKELKRLYQEALEDIELNIKILQADEQTVSRIRRVEYQKALYKQISDTLDMLHEGEFKTIDGFLNTTYERGFVGTMYSLHGQGMPMILPIDHESAIRAVLTDSKLSEPLYDALGMDISKLKKAIAAEVTRGIAQGMSNNEIARNIRNTSKAPLARARTIARTESHRIAETASHDAGKKAISKGADLVKQWDASLDDATRDTHRQLDGKIVEMDEYFVIGTKKALYPSQFGDPAEDCNCRCNALKRSRSKMNAEELNELKKRAEFFGLDKTEDFKEFEKKYLKAAEQQSNIQHIKPHFTPAKTLEGAEEYARRFADDVDFGKLSVKACNKINETLDGLTAKYNVRLPRVGTYSKGNGAAHANWRLLEVKTGYFNKPKSLLTDYTAVIAKNSRQIESALETINTRNPGKQFVARLKEYIKTLENANRHNRWGVVDSYPESAIEVTITHEFGHFLADIFCGQINGEKAWRDSGRLMYSAVAQPKQQAIQRAFRLACESGDIYNVSAYGAKNPHEFFAETFAMRELGEPLPDYISEMFERVFS